MDEIVLLQPRTTTHRNRSRCCTVQRSNRCTSERLNTRLTTHERVTTPSFIDARIYNLRMFQLERDCRTSIKVWRRTITEVDDERTLIDQRYPCERLPCEACGQRGK